MVVEMVDQVLGGDVVVRCGGTCNMEVSLLVDESTLTDEERYVFISGACLACWGDTMP